MSSSPTQCREATTALPPPVIHLPNEIITIIIRYALEDAYPKLLTDPPVRRYDESAADEKEYDMEDNPGKYYCLEWRCRSWECVDNDAFEEACRIMHQQYDDLMYHDAALQYVATATELASVNTSWLQMVCSLFTPKFEEIKDQQVEFRNLFTIPETGPRSLFGYKLNLQTCPDFMTRIKSQYHERLQGCNAITMAFRAERAIFHDCGHKLFCAKAMIEQRAAQTLEMENARLAAENDGLRTALGAANCEVNTLKAELSELRARVKLGISFT